MVIISKLVSEVKTAVDKIKVLFLIHDLGQGGAEKVLVNLVNNLNLDRFDVTVMTLFDVGENKLFLSNKIKYQTWIKKMIPANSYWMKLLSPEMLHKYLIKDKYDIEIAYLEGPCARVISGCSEPNTKKIGWVHIEMHDKKSICGSFRSWHEAERCYRSFDNIICVSRSVKDLFYKMLSPIKEPIVVYNTNETDNILKLAKEPVLDIDKFEDTIKLVSVGKLLKNKGIQRILWVVKRLKQEGYKIHLFILGDGPEKANLNKYIKNNKLSNEVTLLGYQLNPYKYMANSDLLVCASYAEGFSTAVTESLIVGTPVCTVEVSGMKELLGESNEYGIVVKNDDDDLYQGIKSLIKNHDLLSYYTQQAKIRGKDFQTGRTVSAVEQLLMEMAGYEEA